MNPTGWLLTRNPDAGSDEDDAIEVVRAALGDDTEVRATGSPEELDAALDGLDGRCIVVCGGDGSVHVTVKRLLERDELGEVVIGLVPLGTGNDLATSLGIPTDDPEAAAEIVLAGHARQLDLVVADDGEICVNALHAGVGVEAAEEAANLKGALGKLAYPLGAVIAGARAEGLDVRVEVDGRRLVPANGEAALMIAIANAATIGGGTAVAPAAEPDDGLVDVLVSHAIAPAARAAYGAALRSGTHLDRDDVAHTQGEVVRLSGDKLAYNVDGELGRETFGERTWRVRPRAWRILAPPA